MVSPVHFEYFLFHYLYSYIKKEINDREQEGVLSAYFFIFLSYSLRKMITAPICYIPNLFLPSAIMRQRCF